jgi:hypothetical protein
MEKGHQVPEYPIEASRKNDATAAIYGKRLPVGPVLFRCSYSHQSTVPAIPLCPTRRPGPFSQKAGGAPRTAMLNSFVPGVTGVPWLPASAADKDTGGD